MITILRENDAPKSFREKVAEFLARPPMPFIRFHGEPWWEGNTLRFRLRNGLPLDMLYGVYVKGDDGDYAERPDHIGPFSTDLWQLKIGRAHV